MRPASRSMGLTAPHTPRYNNRVAQRVDSALALRERLATALELHERSADDELSALQREDAAAAAQLLRPAQLPLRYDHGQRERRQRP